MRLRLRVSPRRVDDVGLELVMAPVVGDVHELLVGELEVHREFSFPIPAYLAPSVQNVFRAMSVVSFFLPRPSTLRQNSSTPRIAPSPMLRCTCN